MDSDDSAEGPTHVPDEDASSRSSFSSSDFHSIPVPQRREAASPETKRLPEDPSTWPSIDGYVIQEYLGGGGFGSVYRAHSVELDAPVAVKVLRADLAHTGKVRKRFLKEVTTAARHRHQHVVQVLRTGTLESKSGAQLHFMVTEFLPGGDFLTWLKNNPRRSRAGDALRQAVQILADVCAGLASLHESGVAHRDVKPENILLDAQGIAKLADFGLAGVFDEQLTEELPTNSATRSASRDRRFPLVSRLTATGEVFGTLPYMAPELLFGAENATPASDQYSVGVILYMVLSGLRPFQTRPKDPNERDRIEEQADCLRQRQPTPRIYPPSRHGMFSDRGLEFICLKCLRPYAATRYRDAGALRDDLLAWLDGQRVGEDWTTQAWNTYVYLPVRQNPFRVLMTAVTLLTLAAVSFGLAQAWQYSRKADAQNVLLREKNVSLDAANAELADQRQSLAVQVHNTIRATSGREQELGRIANAALADASAFQFLHDQGGYFPHAEDQLSVAAFRTSQMLNASPHLKGLFPGVGAGPVMQLAMPRDRNAAAVLQLGRVSILNPLAGRQSGQFLNPRGRIIRSVLSERGAHAATLATGIRGDVSLESWRTDTGMAVSSCALEGDSPQQTQLAVSDEAQLLYTCLHSGLIEVRELASLDVLTTIDTAAAWNVFLLSPDATSLFLCNQRKLLCLDAGTLETKWSSSLSGDLAESLATSGGTICAGAYSNTGGHIAICSNSGQAVLCDATDGQITVLRNRACLPAVDNWGRLLSRVCFSDDGQFLAFATGDNVVETWDLDRQQPRNNARLHPAIVTDFDLSPDGRQIASVTPDGFIRIWDLHEGASPLHEFRSHAQPTTVRFLADSQEILVGTTDGTTVVWSVPLRFEAKTPPCAATALQAVYGETRQSFVVQSAINALTLYSAATDDELSRIELPHTCHLLRFAADGSTLAALGSEDIEGRVTCVSLSRPSDARVTTRLPTWPLDAAFSPDAAWLAVLGTSPAGNNLHLLHVETGALHTVPDLHPDQIIWNPAFASQLLIANRDGRLHSLALDTSLNDLPAPAELAINSNGQVIRELQISSDGRFVGLVSGESLQVWNTTQEEPVGQVVRHALRGELNGMRFLKAGAQILTWAQDGTVRLWDRPTGDEWEVALELQHGSVVDTAAPFLNETLIVTGGQDGLARFWDATSGFPASPDVRVGPPETVITAIESPKKHQVLFQIANVLQSSNPEAIQRILHLDRLGDICDPDPRASFTTFNKFLLRSLQTASSIAFTPSANDPSSLLSTAELIADQHVEPDGRLRPLTDGERAERIAMHAPQSTTPWGCWQYAARHTPLAKEKRRLLTLANADDAASGRVAFELAEIAFAEGDIGDALSACEEAITRGYLAAGTFQLRGDCFSALGKRLQAIADFETAASLSLLPYQPRLKLGRTLATENRFQEALSAYESALTEQAELQLPQEPQDMYALALLAKYAERAESLLHVEALVSRAGASNEPEIAAYATLAVAIAAPELASSASSSLGPTAPPANTTSQATGVLPWVLLQCRVGDPLVAMPSVERVLQDTDDATAQTLLHLFYAISATRAGRTEDARAGVEAAEELREQWSQPAEQGGWENRVAIELLLRETATLLQAER